MADEVGDHRRDRNGQSVGVEITPIPFVDFLLCCYVYTEIGCIDKNDKRNRRVVNDTKSRRY